jgi:hypothetical protein
MVMRGRDGDQDHGGDGDSGRQRLQAGCPWLVRDAAEAVAGPGDAGPGGPAGTLRGAFLGFAPGPLRFGEPEVGHGGRRGLGKAVQGAREIPGRWPGPHCPERGPDIPEQRS